MNTNENNNKIELADKIFNLECPTLDIGDRVGNTGYIDFIQPNEFNESFRKGIDKDNRRFITIHANIEYENGEIKKTFTTIFERYTGISLPIQSANMVVLFETAGGININQLELLYKLLTEGSVNITEKIINTCHITALNYMHKYKPVKISLVNID